MESQALEYIDMTEVYKLLPDILVNRNYYHDINLDIFRRLSNMCNK